MKTTLLILSILTSIAGCAQQNQQKMNTTTSSRDSAQVIAVTRKLTNLMIERNIAEMDKIVDERFTLTHITGYKQPKAEWFTEIESESMKYYGYKEVSTSVKINGNRAEFIGRNQLDARIWGARNNWWLKQKMQLEKRNDKWIILNSVASTF